MVDVHSTFAGRLQKARRKKKTARNAPFSSTLLQSPPLPAPKDIKERPCLQAGNQQQHA
jgi:hypothetical protein